MNSKMRPTSNFRKVIAPGVIGNALEWYDFSLYGYFAPVIAQLFFPHADKATSLITTFGILALGFLMRPLGGVIFSHYGDKYGRKKVLASAVIVMALATACIGILPTYSQIGAFAGLLLMLCRLLQGLAIGGEYAGSIVYIVEHAPSRHRGFYGSWAMMSTTVGLLLGSAVAAIAEHYINVSWSWRVPFLLGIVLGGIGLYLRLHMPETPYFNAVAEKQITHRRPTLAALSQAPLAMLQTFLLDYMPAIGFYLGFIYFPSYLNLYFNVPLSMSLAINSISLLVVAMMTPIVGRWSDLYGRKKIFGVSALGFLLLSYPLFVFIASGRSHIIVIVQMIFAFFMAFCAGTLPTLMAELFPTPIRYTGIALPYNLANAILGGTAPLVVTILIHKMNNVLAPSYYLMFAALIVLLTLLTIKETAFKALD